MLRQAQDDKVLKSSESLPRARIVRRRSVLDAARQQGRRLNSRWMTLQVLPRSAVAGENSEVAFLTPKRLGAATVRNRLRRRMREIHRRHFPAAPGGPYLVWLARPPALELDFEALRRCMSELRERVKA